MESDNKNKSITDVREEPSRRRFMLIVGWIGFLFTSFLVSLLTLVDFYKPKVLFGPSSKFKAGYPDEYPAGKVSTRWMKDRGVWIIRTDHGIYAFLAICRHLGCIPNWIEEERLFKCPCHGSNYNIEGDVVGGPAPRPLFRLGVSYALDGQLIIDKSVKEDRVGVREKDQFFLPV